MRKTQGAAVSKASRVADLAGAPPQLATSQDLLGANEPLTGRQYPVKRSSKVPHLINLKAVAEALIDEGLDPAAEIARVLKGRPMIDDNGNPVIDPVTGQEVMEHLVDPEIRLRTLNSLLEFVQPKLKAVEVKLNGNLELSSEQLDQRLGALIAKAAKGS
jgi:hypothetical protein